MSKVKTRKELASELGIHSRTLLRWLKKHNIKLSKGLLSPSEQKLIYDTLGFRRAEE